jgi:hypothetical protein
MACTHPRDSLSPHMPCPWPKCPRGVAGNRLSLTAHADGKAVVLHFCRGFVWEAETGRVVGYRWDPAKPGEPCPPVG